MNRLALSLICAFRLVLAKLLSASGDGEIRTLDPLLARQVLSQLSYTPHGCGPPSFLRQSLYSVYLYSRFHSVLPEGNGLKWTRTTDLTLIRRAL